MTFKYDEFLNYIEIGQSIERRFPGSITNFHSLGLQHQKQRGRLQWDDTEAMPVGVAPNSLFTASTPPQRKTL